jgi:hypothetical protein
MLQKYHLRSRDCKLVAADRLDAEAPPAKQAEDRAPAPVALPPSGLAAESPDLDLTDLDRLERSIHIEALDEPDAPPFP